jgi:hypothetical protein
MTHPRPSAGADVVASRLLHQLRASLHVVAGYADLLAREPCTADERRDVDALRAVLRSTLALLDEHLAGPRAGEAGGPTGWSPGRRRRARLHPGQGRLALR